MKKKTITIFSHPGNLYIGSDNMGFGNITYNETVKSLANAQVSRMVNPYYKFSTKKPTKVTYWNINNKHTTLDAGKRDTYDQLGNKSPLRYNRIKDFMIYGFPRTQIEMELNEYGVEAQEIGGEILILPRTIIPQVDDVFTVDYLTKPYMFRIVKVTIDNLEIPGKANFYKCNFILDNTREDWLASINGRQLVKKLKFKIVNVGTNSTCIISEEEDEVLSKLSTLYEKLRGYYIELFYRDNIQTFIYSYLDNQFIYDPYLIEFIIRNGLFNSDDELKYMYVEQAVHTSSTFTLEYNRTIFKDIEDKNSQLHTNSAYMIPVHDPNSLLVDRMEDYLQLSVNLMDKPNSDPVNQLNNNLFDHIQENTPFDEENEANHVLYWNIIINYMNQDEFSITAKQLESLERLKYRYILQQYMNNIQKEENTESEEEASAYLENCFAVGK